MWPGIFEQNKILSSPEPEPVSITDNMFSLYNLDETTAGAVAIDSISGHNSSANSALVNQTGKVGTSYDFGVTNDRRIVIPHHSDFSFRENGANIPGSFGMWIYPRQDFVSTRLILNKRNPTNSAVNSEYQFYWIPGGWQFNIWNSDGTNVHVAAPDTIVANEWVYIGLDIMPDKETPLQFYKNDAPLPGTITGTVKDFHTTTAPIVIGRAGWVADLYVPAKLDQIALWRNRAVGVEVFSQIYNEGNGIEI